MKSESFVYWLQGFFEVSGATELNAQQTEAVKRHLALVFKHEIDPAMGEAKHQADLNAIHHTGNAVLRC